MSLSDSDFAALKGYGEASSNVSRALCVILKNEKAAAYEAFPGAIFTSNSMTTELDPGWNVLQSLKL